MKMSWSLTPLQLVSWIPTCDLFISLCFLFIWWLGDGLCFKSWGWSSSLSKIWIYSKWVFATCLCAILIFQTKWTLEAFFLVVSGRTRSILDSWAKKVKSPIHFFESQNGRVVTLVSQWSRPFSGPNRKRIGIFMYLNWRICPWVFLLLHASSSSSFFFFLLFFFFPETVNPF